MHLYEGGNGKGGSEGGVPSSSGVFRATDFVVAGALFGVRSPEGEWWRHFCVFLLTKSERYFHVLLLTKSPNRAFLFGEAVFKLILIYCCTKLNFTTKMSNFVGRNSIYTFFGFDVVFCECFSFLQSFLL